MKKIIILSIAASLLIVTSCKKENRYPSKVVKVSHPTLTLNGDAILILAQGSIFNDPGANYFDSTTLESGTVKTTDSVNTSVEGISILSYTAMNKNGFETTITRTIAITGISDLFDISGTYHRASNGAPALVTKAGKGLFITNNVSGSATATKDSAFFMFTSDSTMIMPTQFLPNFQATADFVNPVYDFTAATPQYSYIVDNPLVFSPAVRVFVKQ